ncbi:MAG TPA: DUF1592 domain-containing protein [Polyangiaceae bacterium]|nr:DUF1592 domain-containing protein [Polyangiaceae bacterium]
MALSLLLGCTGVINDDGQNPAPGPMASGGGGGTTATSSNPLCQDGKVRPGRAPLRRLTRFEYNNTVRDLLGDTTKPANDFPSEELGNGFGNDADTLSVSSLLAEKYVAAAEALATSVTSTPAALAALHTCAATVTTDTEAACARSVLESVGARAWRRPLETTEVDELAALYALTREGTSFAVGVASAIEAILQSPDFLYRIEWGVPDASRPELKRPSGYEMATRLSYLFWGSTPDATLTTAASSGALTTAEGIRAQAAAMLDDARSRPVVRFFFDNLLPIPALTALERDEAVYPTFYAAIGQARHEETPTFLEYEIFQGGGTWPSVLTAPYTFMNGPLATYYGVPGVTGDAFQMVQLDTTKRLGLLTQASIMAGTTHSNHTNPVVRGSFIVQKLMCKKLALPGPELAALVKPPDPYSGATARDRFSQHSADIVCAGCHQFMDPIGLALENYDAVGLYRETENGVVIDASGGVPDTGITVNGPIELAQRLSEQEETNTCFASHWANFAYGRVLDESEDDACTQTSLNDAFKASGYNVKQLLIALTQSDAFLYLPGAQ